jgi:hypothetical protein
VLLHLYYRQEHHQQYQLRILFLILLHLLVAVEVLLLEFFQKPLFLVVLVVAHVVFLMVHLEQLIKVMQVQII